uniref:Uncharacterized protein n=1 Tax=Arundo donax TaxID=35708 RepID=A0A0A9PZW4_ARUDO
MLHPVDLHGQACPLCNCSALHWAQSHTCLSSERNISDHLRTVRHGCMHRAHIGKKSHLVEFSLQAFY